MRRKLITLSTYFFATIGPAAMGLSFLAAGQTNTATVQFYMLGVIICFVRFLSWAEDRELL